MKRGVPPFRQGVAMSASVPGAFGSMRRRGPLKARTQFTVTPGSLLFTRARSQVARNAHESVDESQS